MQQHAELAIVATDHDALAPVVGQLDQMPVAVGVGAGLGQPEDDLGARVRERERHRGADVLRLGVAVAHLVEEVAQQAHRVEARAREAAVDERWMRASSGRNASAAAIVASDADSAEPPTTRPTSSATSA